MRVCVSYNLGSAIRRTAMRLWHNRRGNVLVMSALACPALAFLMLDASSIMLAMGRRTELSNIAKTACNQGLKPTRTDVYNDSDRKRMAEALLARLAAERKITLTSSTVTEGFLSGSVTAATTISGFSFLVGNGRTIPISVAVTCQGVPPYPTKNSVVLSSEFTRPTTAPLLNAGQDWAVFKPQDYGWDSGTGPGVEIQNWSTGAYFGTLPPGATNPYVVELDSDNGGLGNTNSSMTKRIELHRGTYQFSIWYFGRVEDVNTNRISVYLTGVRPVSPKVQKLTMSEPRSKGWIRYQFDVPVTQYSVYDLTIAAEGTDDSFGGNFNSLELKYIKRPSDKYTD